MQRQMLSLAVIILFLLPLLPSPPSAAPASLSEEPGNSEIQISDSSSNVQPISHGVPTAASEADEPAPVEVPAPPDYQEFSGSPRATVLQWNRTRVFNNRDQSADFAVTGETGMLYHEVNNFTRLSTGRTKIIVEDYNPWDPLAPYYAPGVNVPVFIGFRIPPQLVAIDGFWIFLWGPSSGLINFTIFRARPGVAPALAQPNLTAPVRWPALQAIVPSIANGNGSWVWLDTNETNLILDSASTYANTYFFVIWRPAASSKLQPVLTYDTAWPDMVDESDSYVGWSPPAYQLWDFFLNVSIIQYPTYVNMRVNGLPVQDVKGQPTRGFWENWLAPAFNMTGATRLYDVTSLAPTLVFDVTWFGQFYASITAEAICRVWANKPSVDWEIRFEAAFPSTAAGRVIVVSIETDWDVSAVHFNGLPFTTWTKGVNYIRITNALSGSWFILCKAPNYAMAAEVHNLLGEEITEANASDQVTVWGYLHDPLGVNVTNGWGYLLVYDPDDTLIFLNYVPINPLPGGIVDIGWWIWESGTGAGKYVLQVLWANGTEAGMVVTVLTVYSGTYLVVTYEYPSSPTEPIIRGDTVIIEVYYYYDEFQYMYPVDNAIIQVYNGSIAGGVYWPGYDWYNWASSGYPGYYTAYLYTDFVTPGVLNNVTMQIYADYSEEQSYPKQFMVKTKVTRILFFWNGNPLPGLTNTSPTDWRTSPEPYLNDSSLQFTIMYTDESGFPLPGAQLSPFIIVNGTNQYKRLNWIDLSDVDSSSAGLYNISIDTNPIGDITLHEGDVCRILIYAYKAGYEYTWSSPVWVRPRPRPSFIDVPVQYQTIELYVNWTYTSALRVVLRDALSFDDLSCGSLEAYIPGLGNVTLDLATPGLGLYEIRDLDTTNIPIGTRNITIYATASDFTPSTANVTLIILAKQEIGYYFRCDYQSWQPNLGTRCNLTIQFFFKAGSASQVAMCGISWLGTVQWRQAGNPLPEGTKVTLSIERSAVVAKSVILTLDANGTASYDYYFDVEGEYYFFVTIEKAEDYAKLEHVCLEQNGAPLGVSIVSSLSYLTARLPFYALIAALAIVIPLGGYLGYRQAVVLPCKRRRLAKYQSIADTFSDVANLNRLLVLHKESGICVFDPFSEETKDATLVAGFLQAISTFGHDLVESPGLAGKDKEQASTLRELTYEGFRILIHDGHFVRNALVLSGKPSDQLRERLERFTGEFEKRYRKDFDHWSGRVDQFNSASDLVEEIFLVSLRLPHRVQARRPRGVSLSPLEDDLYKLAKELTKDREYIFLGQILSTYLITAKHNKLEALMGIYQLRSKGLLLPWQLDTTMTAASEGADNGAQ